MARNSVYIVDDDAAVRDSMAQLLSMHGYDTRQFSDAAGYLDEAEKLPRGCVLLDIRMPGMSGIELQEELRRRGRNEPIVFVTGHGDVGLAVKAMKAGAVDFLEKPLDQGELLVILNRLLSKAKASAPSQEALRQSLSRLDRLTHRERQVFDGLAIGKTNKGIALDLSISPRTVEIHRARVMEKLEAGTLSDLIRLALTSGSRRDGGSPGFTDKK